MIANKINDLRNKRKITEKELAENIGMSVTGYRQALEKRDFKVSTLYKISEFLQVPITYWFDNDEKNNVYLDNQGNIINQSNVRGGVSVGSNNAELLQKEIESLKNENNMLRELIQAKDEMIKLLKEK